MKFWIIYTYLMLGGFIYGLAIANHHKSCGTPVKTPDDFPSVVLTWPAAIGAALAYSISDSEIDNSCREAGK